MENFSEKSRQIGKMEKEKVENTAKSAKLTCNLQEIVFFLLSPFAFRLSLFFPGLAVNCTDF